TGRRPRDFSRATSCPWRAGAPPGTRQHAARTGDRGRTPGAHGAATAVPPARPEPAEPRQRDSAGPGERGAQGLDEVPRRHPSGPELPEIAAADGHSYSFVVTGRARWITAIVQARGGSAGAGHR